MLGVTANALAIIFGSLVGLLFRAYMSEKLRLRVEMILGYCTVVIGLKMAMRFENVLIFIGCIGLGGLLGWACNLESNIERGAQWLQKKIMRGRESRFAAGLSFSSILFCVGGMAVVGSIQSGLLNNHDVLFTKALLDGTISAPLAGIYGVGVAFSAIPVFLYQGGIALLAQKASFLGQASVVNEISGVGGALITMIGMNLAKISKVPVGDFLPAMLLVLLSAFL